MFIQEDSYRSPSGAERSEVSSLQFGTILRTKFWQTTDLGISFPDVEGTRLTKWCFGSVERIPIGNNRKRQAKASYKFHISLKMDASDITDGNAKPIKISSDSICEDSEQCFLGIPFNEDYATRKKQFRASSREIALDILKFLCTDRKLSERKC
ncbi:hypothetical protein ASF08_23330 [Methylobacterium sp. Leaf85]|nr:hypothetical protein ASF08_23330 [Methylobacterium sp. Leaf85]